MSFYAANGLDAIHKARLVMPDLILMDADMPQCDGYTACRVITQDPASARIPVIFLSGHSPARAAYQGVAKTVLSITLASLLCSMRFCYDYVYICVTNKEYFLRSLKSVLGSLPSQCRQS